MDISELIEIARAGADGNRIETGALSPASISGEAVGGLASIMSELLHAAASFSTEADKIRVISRIEPEGYVIEVLGWGMGVSDRFLESLNRLLEDPGGPAGQNGSMSGMHLVAGLAARHGIAVCLLRGDPGVTARVSVPWHLIGEAETLAAGAAAQGSTSDESADGAGERTPSHGLESEEADAAPEEVVVTPGSPDLDAGSPGRIRGRSEADRAETEAFLESVFQTLVDGDVPPAEAGTAIEESVFAEAEDVVGDESVLLEEDHPDELAVRVPGESYEAQSEDDSDSRAGDAAADVKEALAEYLRGREAATTGPDQ